MRCRREHHPQPQVQATVPEWGKRARCGSGGRGAVRGEGLTRGRGGPKKRRGRDIFFYFFGRHAQRSKRREEGGQMGRVKRRRARLAHWSRCPCLTLAGRLLPCFWSLVSLLFLFFWAARWLSTRQLGYPYCSSLNTLLRNLRPAVGLRRLVRICRAEWAKRKSKRRGG